jgi:hypothetical protein
MISWTHCEIETAKDMVQKISLGVSTSGTLFLVFVYFKDSKKQKREARKKSSFFSHDYHGPKLKRIFLPPSLWFYYSHRKNLLKTGL